MHSFFFPLVYVNSVIMEYKMNTDHISKLKF
jgi:hypothetical protein